ncbi:MAG: YcjX family protein [Pseudomonadota bacterium]
MVLTTLADGLLNTGRGIIDAGSDLVGTPTVRLGVTGLARSGKTVFITSLVSNLMDRGRMPHLLAHAQGRIEAAYLQPQPNDTIPRFDIEAHKAALLGDPPAWPESTRAVSELRLSLKVRPAGLLAGWQGVRTLHVDIIDYPGEWLLDLALLDQDYAAWSDATLARVRARPQGAAYRAALDAVDPSARLDELVAKQLAAAFTAYLTEARAAGFYDCTPGRFLLPGDLAGSPVLTFAPLPAGDAPRRSLRREMARRFEVYKRAVVTPFFRDHFSRIDRQVVLVDALGAIHSGPEAVADMRRAMGDILGAFRPGRNAFLTQLLRGRRVEKVLFAATKADHIHHTQHDRLTAIMAALTRAARDRARFAGAETEALALAALRTTTEAQVTHEGATLDMVQGTLLDTGKTAAFYPGQLPEDPASLLSGDDGWLDDEYAVMRFAPARMSLRPGDGPPHIRMDRAAQFLIGDKL